MRRHTTLLLWLAAAIALGRCRTLFPYIGSGNRFTVRTAVPMNFPTNKTFLRVFATSDVTNTSRAIEYAAVASTNRSLPFKVTADGGVQLSRQVKFRKKKKDWRRYKFNIIAGLPSERAEARAVLAVEVTVTRSPLDCSAISDTERCWGPWSFLSGLQWFAAAESGPAGGDPLRLDLRSPLHVLCGAPSYRYSTDRGQTDDVSAGSSAAEAAARALARAPAAVADGAAVSVAHLEAPGRQPLQLRVSCRPGGAHKEDISSEETKVLGVEVLDRNNHAPEMDWHGTVHDVYLCKQNRVFKDDPVMSAVGAPGRGGSGRPLERPNVYVRDGDEHQRSHYDVRVEGDSLGLLYVKHGHLPVPTGEGEERRIESSLFAELRYKKDPYRELGPDFNYSVQVVFEDKYLHHSYGEKALRLTVNLLSSCPPAPVTSPPPLPEAIATVAPGTTFTASVPRNAVRYARVFQLPRALIGHRVRLAQSAEPSQLAFNVTSRDAILFVSRPGRLREVSGVVNVTLLAYDAGERGAAPLLNVTVRVNVTESAEGCPERSSADSQLCAAESSEEECEYRCGAGSAGPCRWRPPQHSSKMTSEYGTCSPDLTTCPDGTCDELEQLSPNICPQDCSHTDGSSGMFMTPGSLGRGVKSGRGVCFCPKATLTCVCGPEKHLPRASDKNLSEEQRALSTSATPRSELAAAHETSVCGTACIIGVSFGVVLLLAMLLLACMLYDSRCLRSSKMRKDPFGGEGISLSHITGDIDLGGRQQMALPSDAQCAISAQLLETVPVDDKWEFPRRRLVLGELLGEGEFGKVLNGKAMGITGGSGCSQVAVKMLKPSSTPAELQDLLSEYNLLKEVNHPNVIRLLGACTGPGGPVCIIMEFAELGCLRTYLCNSRKSTLAAGGADSACAITPKELISYAWQISRGMAYLGQMKLVHRDLAARNVLLADGKVCKISDFGLTRDVYEGSLYQKTSKGRVPVKWMAIESLEDHVYTSKSDVWSFGILLWELITLGSNPYPGVTPERLCHLLKSGYRMDRPANCTQDMYSIMRQCWQEQPSSRPTFAELSQWFDRMLQSGSEYLDLSTPLVLNREYFDLLSDGEDFGMDRPIDYGNLHLLSSSYLPPRSQPAADEPRADQSPRRAPAAHQSPFRAPASDQSALRPDLLVYSSLLLHGVEAEEPAGDDPGDLPLNYSSLLLPDSEPEEEDSGSGSSDAHTRETCDEQCGLMHVSV